MWIDANKTDPNEFGTYCILGQTGGARLSRFDEHGWNAKGAVHYWMPIPKRPVERVNDKFETKYLNHENREIAGYLAAMQGYTESLLTRGFRRGEEIRPLLSVASDLYHAALDAFIDGLDADQYSAIVRMIKNTELVFVPKFNPQSKEKEKIVNVDDLLELADIATEETCAFCDKTEKEQGKCRLRKCLLRLDANVDEGKSECPFKGRL